MLCVTAPGRRDKGHRHFRWARRLGWTLAGVAFVAAPLATVGLATPLGFAFAAALFGHLGRRPAIMLWGSVAVYAVSAAVALANFAAPPDSLGHSAAFIAVMINMVGGGIHAMVFTSLVIAHRYRPRWDRVARAADPTPAWRVIEVGAAVAALAFSADGRTLTVGTRRFASVVDLVSGAVIRRIRPETHLGWVTAITLSADGTRMACGDHTGRAVVLDTESGTGVVEIRHRGGQLLRLLNLAISPDRARLATTGGNGIVAVWDLPGGGQALTVDHSGQRSYRRVPVTAFSPDDGTVLATGDAGGTVRMWRC